ncbi:hypothetical protein CMI37_22760 [Candidatus Pacearchaeota archaeon]|nr:hypothetical protein [Candidatus Pacearchaeota archaeon]|tara:strand:+ start:69 stop:578 length:510 start_codon:yes stop_codon:yes gene_type:complete
MSKTTVKTREVVVTLWDVRSVSSGAMSRIAVAPGAGSKALVSGVQLSGLVQRDPWSMHHYAEYAFFLRDQSGNTFNIGLGGRIQLDPDLSLSGLVLTDARLSVMEGEPTVLVYSLRRLLVEKGVRLGVVQIRYRAEKLKEDKSDASVESDPGSELEVEEVAGESEKAAS